MDFEIKQLITDFLEWQVTNHGKGEGVLAAWKEVFAPKDNNGSVTHPSSRTIQYVAMRKSKQMKSVALFFDKSDVVACIPTIRDSEETDSICVNKEFSSLFQALTYMATMNSSELTTGRIKANEIGASNEFSNSKDTMTTLAQVDKDDKCSNNNNNNNKRDLQGSSANGHVDTLEPSSKRLKTEGNDVMESMNPETPEKDSSEPDGNKKPSQFTKIRFKEKERQWQGKFEALASLWKNGATIYQRDIAPFNGLSNWVKHQRKRFKQNTLREDRKKKLDSIGFKWVGRNTIVLSTEPNNEKELAAMKHAYLTYESQQKQGLDVEKEDGWEILWKQRYQELVEFKKRFGHTKVPKEWPENKQLAGWVRKQREQSRRPPEESMLTESRKQRLNDIGFAWFLRPSRLKRPPPPDLTPKPDPKPEMAPEPEEPAGQTCIMGKEDESHDVEPYSVDKNGYLII
ncbi:unnamed protein product [Cylindrotheca closterium]|uniref:Helicase-associated domain-containing protein n=1 Tax=Cylindrotheca closterium TaxID=2856 RepID=A0AAD2JKF1_9STRA|nr:unnamed protein product [Cylindrotheca closterium]